MRKKIQDKCSQSVLSNEAFVNVDAKQTASGNGVGKMEVTGIIWQVTLNKSGKMLAYYLN